MMKRRTGLMIAAALTAFILVFIGAVARLFTPDSSAPAQAAAQEVEAAQPPAALSAPASESAATSAPAQAYPISPDQASQQASTVAPPGAQMLRAPELVDYNGTVAYEVPFDGGNVYVDANTGQVLGSTLPTRARRGEHESDHHEHDRSDHDNFEEPQEYDD